MKHRSSSDAYRCKAAFFDNQINTPWASDEYGPEEYKRLERLRAALGPMDGQTVLEPGCGTGRMTEVLSGWVGPSGRVTALDISAKMMARAASRLGGLDNVSLLKDSLEQIRIAPSSIDLVLHHQVFPHYHNKALALEISTRLVKPGGLVVVFHFINSDMINDTHRKAGTAVEFDMMPGQKKMYSLLAEAGLSVDFILDDALGYFLLARRKREALPSS
jgi:demethylmenaquinone methyltransferase/2-methoxy-6-polyprenyl-1,4-benzoquinol methylase